LHTIAALELAAECVNFLEAMTCYHNVDCVVAVPPSDPEKAYSLPKVLSAGIAKARGIKDFSVFVSTKTKRASIKSKEAAKKLPTLRGTIELEPDKFSGRTVLLIDDLYQSGTTMNYCAKLIHDAGAKSVLGLACVKTCSNDDNF
jgi:predicted amidophosphoribosyltransferase